MRVELIVRAHEVLAGLPDDVHEEVLALIDTIADAPGVQPAAEVAAFGASSWVTCGVADTVEVLDVGWLG